MKKKVVLAFSGGLDTSFCCIHLAQDRGLEVHSVIVNTGGFSEEELQEIRTKSADALFEGTMKQFHPSAERVNELVGSAFEKGCYYLVSRQENKLAGWVLIGPSTDFFSKEEIGFIYELYVVPEYRGNGDRECSRGCD